MMCRLLALPMELRAPPPVGNWASGEATPEQAAARDAFMSWNPLGQARLMLCSAVPSQQRVRGH